MLFLFEEDGGDEGGGGFFAAGLAQGNMHVQTLQVEQRLAILCTSEDIQDLLLHFTDEIAVLEGADAFGADILLDNEGQII